MRIDYSNQIQNLQNKIKKRMNDLIEEINKRPSIPPKMQELKMLVEKLLIMLVDNNIDFSELSKIEIIGNDDDLKNILSKHENKKIEIMIKIIKLLIDDLDNLINHLNNY